MTTQPKSDAHITIRKAKGTWVVRAAGSVIAETKSALELSEDGHEPVIYFPRGDIAMAFLDRSKKTATSPDKGEATYFSVVTSEYTLRDAAWSYETPADVVSRIADHVAFRDSNITVEQL